MIVIGVLLAIAAVLIPLPSILLWLGILLVIAGVILNFVPIGGARRRVY